MKKEEYKAIVKKNTKKEKVFVNTLTAFFFGGLVGVIGQLITSMYVNIFGFNINDAYTLTMITIVGIASLLTGLGVMDKLMCVAKGGLIVPTTGFANSLTSPAMDYRKEGFIKGIGSNMFKLAGCIILYGIFFGFIIGVLKGVLS